MIQRGKSPGKLENTFEVNENKSVGSRGSSTQRGSLGVHAGLPQEKPSTPRKQKVPSKPKKRSSKDWSGNKNKAEKLKPVEPKLHFGMVVGFN